MMENKEDYKIYSTVEKQEVEGYGIRIFLWKTYLITRCPGDGKSTFMINNCISSHQRRASSRWKKA